MNRMLARKADVDRIYLPCQEGGRSLMNLEKEYKATMIGLQTYMTNKDDVPDTSCPLTPELQGSSLCMKGS